MFDAHAHLTRPPEVGAVTQWILPGVHPTAPPADLLADPRVHVAHGLHPWHVPDDVQGALEALEGLASAHPPAAIGETGLDRSRRGSERTLQAAAFRGQVDLAARLDLPLILHVVRSHGACQAVLHEAGFTRGGMVHDFQGPVETVRDWVRAGFLLSISPRGLARSEVLAAIPDAHLLAETDDSGPHRLPDVIAALAAARGSTPEAIATLTADNARRLFL